MTEESYHRLFRFLERHGIRPVYLEYTGKIVTFGTAAAYFSALAALVLQERWRLLAGLILVPALSFGFVSLLRRLLHAKRPYEIYDFQPLVPKDTKEKSFPSRHVFSIFVIGTGVLWVNVYLGVAVLVSGILLALLRVCIGVHFPRDVVAGAVIGLSCGLFVGIFSLC